MIRHLPMNVNRNLNLFPAKGGGLAHYIPHMILSLSKWDYNKQCQVEFSAYLQASQVNYPKNTNLPRTLDGIYLFLAPHLQGGNQIMDLWTVQLIKIPKLVEIPITIFVINAVEKWRRSRYLSH